MVKDDELLGDLEILLDDAVAEENHLDDAEAGTVVVGSHLVLVDEGRRRVAVEDSRAVEVDSLLVVVDSQAVEGIGRVDIILELVMEDSDLEVAHHNQAMVVRNPVAVDLDSLTVELLDILVEVHRNLMVDNRAILLEVVDIDLADIVVDLEYLLGSLA